MVMVTHHRVGQLKGSQSVDKLRADHLRIRELERELAIAKIERDILKKATQRMPPSLAYFTSGGDNLVLLIQL